MIGRLSVILDRWEKAGIISGEQREKIITYENEKSPDLNWAAYIVIGLGAFVLSIGAISLIAYNWENIPDIVKLLADFLVLVILSVAAIMFYESRNRIYQVLSMIFYMIVLASIGLISQIYNLGGELYQALFLWGIITIPLLLVSGNRFISHVWIFSSVACFFSYVSYASVYVKYFSDHSDFIFQSILSSVTVYPSLFLFASVLLGRSDSEDLKVTSRAFLFWSVLSFLCGTVFFSLVWDDLWYEPMKKFEIYYFAFAAALMFAAVSLGMIFSRDKRNVVMIATCLILYYLMSLGKIIDVHSLFLDACLFIIMWFISSVVFYRFGYKRLFNFFIIGVGIRFLVVYFQVFGDLAITGYGLIFSGLLIIGAAVLFIKKKDRITYWMDKIS